MKIHELPMGARFRYEGESYVKTGPLFASGPNGQRLIPKYAQLEPLDGAGPSTVSSAAEPSVALDVCEAACLGAAAEGKSEVVRTAFARLRAALKQ